MLLAGGYWAGQGGLDAEDAKPARELEGARTPDIAAIRAKIDQAAASSTNVINLGPLTDEQQQQAKQWQVEYDQVSAARDARMAQLRTDLVDKAERAGVPAEIVQKWRNNNGGR